MEEVLSIDNILGASEIESLFDETDDTTPKNSETEDVKDNKETKKNETTETPNVDELFNEESEGVGSGKDEKGEKEGTESDKGKGTSPKKNFYSSIASALKDEGIFPDLDDETVKSIKSDRDLAEAVEKQVQAKFDERQKRIDDALNANIEPNVIRQYEKLLTELDSIKEESIKDEGEKGERLRQNLIYQDFINKGYSKERALREVKKSFDTGSDIEDAKEALENNKKFFQNQYDELIEEAQSKEKEQEENIEKQNKELKKSILEDEKVFGDLVIDKATRQKIYDNVSKASYKDPDTGKYYTAIQKYEKENKTDFLKKLGVLFTLTDGFKNLDGLVKSKVRKEVKKGLKDLENALNNTVRDSDGNLRYVGGSEEDPNSTFRDWELDI